LDWKVTLAFNWYSFTVYGKETRAQARQLQYDVDGDDDDDNGDDNINNNDTNNRFNFTSYLRKIFWVGLPLYKRGLVFSHIVCYGVQDPYKYKKSSSLTFD